MKTRTNFYILSLFLLALACASDEEKNEQVEDSSNFNYEEWFDKIKQNRHPDLKGFSYEMIDEETKYKEGEIRRDIIGDSLIVTYCKTVWVGCQLEGGLELKKEYLELTHRPICPPDTKSFVTEEASMKFRFVLLNEKKYATKEIKIKEA